MTRATHLSSIVIALITLTTALVPPQVNKADHAVRDLSPREICAADKKILLDAAAAGLKPVHAAADSFPRKRQLPNEFCVQDALLSSFQSDPEATSLCAALIGDVPVTVTVSTSGSTTSTTISSTTRPHSTATTTTTTAVVTTFAPAAATKKKRGDAAAESAAIASYSSVISACDCLSIPVATVTTTFTVLNISTVNAIQYVDPTSTSIDVITTTSTLSLTSANVPTITLPPDGCDATASASYWTSTTVFSNGSYEVWKGYSCAETSVYSTAYSTEIGGGPAPTTTAYPTVNTTVTSIPEPSSFPTNATTSPSSISTPVTDYRNGTAVPPITTAPWPTPVSIDTSCTDTTTSSISSSGEPRLPFTVTSSSKSTSKSTTKTSVSSTTSATTSSTHTSYVFPSYTPATSPTPMNTTTSATSSISSSGEPRLPFNISSTTTIGPVMTTSSSIYIPVPYPYSPPVWSPSSSTPVSPANTSTPPRSTITSSSAPRYPFNITSSTSLVPTAPFSIPGNTTMPPGTGTGSTPGSPVMTSSAPGNATITSSTAPRYPFNITTTPSAGPTAPFSVPGNSSTMPGTGTSPAPSSTITSSSAPRYPGNVTSSTHSGPTAPFSIPGNATSTMPGTGTAPVSTMTPLYPVNATMSSSSMPTAPYTMSNSTTAPPTTATGTGITSLNITTSAPFNISSTDSPRLPGNETSTSKKPSSTTSTCPVCTTATTTIANKNQTTTTTTTQKITSTITVTETRNTCSYPAYNYGPYGLAAVADPTPAVVAVCSPPFSTPTTAPASASAVTAACANPGDVLADSGFESVVDGSSCAAGWNVVSFNGSGISFADVAVAETGQQRTAGGERVGRVNATEGGGVRLGLWQEVVLCPETEYYLEAWVRQVEGPGVCSAVFYVGDELLFTATPGGGEEGESEGFIGFAASYVSGATAGDVGVYVAVVVGCDGEGVLDLDDVTLSYNA